MKSQQTSHKTRLMFEEKGPCRKRTTEGERNDFRKMCQTKKKEEKPGNPCGKFSKIVLIKRGEKRMNSQGGKDDTSDINLTTFFFEIGGGHNKLVEFLLKKAKHS